MLEYLVLLLGLSLLLLEFLRLLRLILIDLLGLIELFLSILFLLENGTFALVEGLPSLQLKTEIQLLV